jgi:hypothetical protein
MRVIKFLVTWLVAAPLMLSLVVAVPFAAPAQAQQFDNAKIADAGLAEVGTRRATGDNMPGECVKSAQRWVAAAGGYFGGGNVISSYVNSGAVEIPLNEAAKGDVLQYTPPTDSYWPDGVHTVVVVANLGGGKFSIVQSNAAGYVNGVWRTDADGLVTVNPDWAPTPPTGWTTRAWRFGISGPPSSNGGGLITSVSNGRCMDVPRLLTTNGAQLQAADCNGGANQRFVIEGKTVRVYGNYTKCLDEDGAANGGRIQIWDCHGGPNQQWNFYGDGTIRSIATGKCLDLDGPSQKIQAWDCFAGTNQRWNRW